MIRYEIRVVFDGTPSRITKSRVKKEVGGKMWSLRREGARGHAASIACVPGVERVEVERVDRKLIDTLRRGCDGRCKSYRTVPAKRKKS